MGRAKAVSLYDWQQCYKKNVVQNFFVCFLACCLFVLFV